MLPFDGGADLIQAELVEDLLEEQVACIKGALLIRGDCDGRGKGDRNSRIFLSFFFI